MVALGWRRLRRCRGASRAGLTGNQVVPRKSSTNTSTDASNTGSTDGTSMTMQQIAAVASPSVVAITTEQMSSSQTWFGGYYVQSGAGSGIIVSQDGYILTCAHVVSGATSVKVQLNGSDQSQRHRCPASTYFRYCRAEDRCHWPDPGSHRRRR